MLKLRQEKYYCCLKRQDCYTLRVWEYVTEKVWKSPLSSIGEKAYEGNQNCERVWKWELRKEILCANLLVIVIGIVIVIVIVKVIVIIKLFKIYEMLSEKLCFFKGGEMCHLPH